MMDHKDKSNSLQLVKSQSKNCRVQALSLILCTGLFCCPYSLATVKDLSIAAHYAFDEGSGAILHDKSGDGNDGKIVGAGWIKGKNGASLDFDGSDFIDIGDYANLRPSGPITLMVWFRTISSEQQFILSYYGWNIFLASGGNPVLETLLGGAWDSMSSPSKVSLNKWTFLAVVYDPDQQVQEIYLDGKLSISKPRTERPWNPGQHFRSKVSIGGRGFTGLMGDVRAYRHALSAGEIEAVYREFTIDESLESSLYRFSMKPHLLFCEQKIAVELSMVGPRKNGGKEKSLGAFVTEIALRKIDQKESLQQQGIGNLAELKKTEVMFSLESLKPGDYEILASAKSPDGTLLARESAYIALPEKPQWFGCTAGKEFDNKIFAPYTALKVESASDSVLNMKMEDVRNNPTQVECWGRKYEFTTGVFPRQIVTSGHAILAEPIKLAARADGREVNWKSSLVRLKKQTPAKVALSNKIVDAALELTADMQIEYDGMIRVDLKITPVQDCNIENLSVEIPLRKEFATLQYQCRDRFFKAPGSIPEKGIVRSFNPAIWLGNEECGLQWFTDSDQYWYSDDPDKAIEIVPDGEKVILRLNLVAKSFRLQSGKALCYTFGLQATPVKPVEKDQWDYRWASAPQYGGEYAMLTDTIEGESVLDCYAKLGVRTIMLMNWTDALGYPLPLGRDEDFRKLIKAIHQRGMKVVPYYGLQYSEMAPEFAAFKDDFLVQEKDAPYSFSGYPDNYPGGMPTQMTYVPCIRSEWANLMIAGVVRLMDNYDVDGIYFDNESVIASGCLNPAHPGCGKLIRPDGSSTRSFSIFEGRDFFRRIYQIVKSRKPDGIVDIHPASFVVAPAMSWATGTWDGETILGEDRLGGNPQKGEFILSYLSLESFRSQFMGKNWGVPVEFIDYYVPYPYERQFAITMLHDVPIRAHMAIEKVRFEASVWRVLEEFGRKQAEWLPYWKNSEYVTTNSESTYVSLYQHPNNGVLAVVSNLKKEKAQMTVAFSLAKLGLAEKSTAVNALTSESIAIEKGQIKLELDSVDWRLVWIKP